MLTVQTFLFLLMLSLANSEIDYETMCKDDYSDLNKDHINVLKYCSDKLCIEKCCGTGEIINLKNKCVNTILFFKNHRTLSYLAARVNYSNNILSSGEGINQSKSFVFVQNHRDVFNCTSELRDDIEYNISEDGSLLYKDTMESKELSKVERLTYCMDYKLMASNNKPAVKIIIRQIHMNPDKFKRIEKFETAGVLISSFFLLLVLVVYSLLPDKKLVDLLLMAYTFSLLFAFINKLILTFVSRQPEPPSLLCKILSPIVYFAFVSSIFWLSVFAFEGFWRFIPFNNRRDTKHKILVKFMRYSLCAWGIPLLLTAVVATLDNLPNLDIVPPPFQQCMISGFSFDLYYKIPIGILLFINIVLFCMTLYNIKDSREKKRFVTYAKLSVMMGVFWTLELLPPSKELEMYILINLVNLLTGVILFYLYVCNKKVLRKLCKRFNIQNDYIKRMETQKSSKSETTRSSGLLSSIVRKFSKDHGTNMFDGHKGENTGIAEQYVQGYFKPCKL